MFVQAVTSSIFQVRGTKVKLNHRSFFSSWTTPL